MMVFECRPASLRCPEHGEMGVIIGRKKMWKIV